MRRKFLWSLLPLFTEASLALGQSSYPPARASQPGSAQVQTTRFAEPAAGRFAAPPGWQTVQAGPSSAPSAVPTPANVPSRVPAASSLPAGNGGATRFGPSTPGSTYAPMPSPGATSPGAMIPSGSAPGGIMQPGSAPAPYSSVPYSSAPYSGAPTNGAGTFSSQPLPAGPSVPAHGMPYGSSPGASMPYPGPTTGHIPSAAPVYSGGSAPAYSGGAPLPAGPVHSGSVYSGPVYGQGGSAVPHGQGAPMDLGAPPVNTGESCGLDCFLGCGCEGNYTPRVWVGAEYLLWWVKQMPVPPLVTTGSPNDPLPGALGQPNTRVLVGNENLGAQEHSGGRFTLGVNLDELGQWGLEGNYMFLGLRGSEASVRSNGTALLARPIVNWAFFREEGIPISNPGRLTGLLNIDTTTRLEGGEGNVLWTPCCLAGGQCVSLHFLSGFRYLALNEGLTLTQVSTDISGGPTNGTRAITLDEFSTRNLFYGTNLGLRTDWRYGRLWGNAIAKCALGYNEQTLSIAGASRSLAPNGVVTANGNGLLTQISNISEQERRSFSVVPEGALNFGVQVRPWMSLTAGYTFLYANHVLRPGEQVDRVINFVQTPGAALGQVRPSPIIKETDFWAQGVSLGLELSY